MRRLWWITLGVILPLVALIGGYYYRQTRHPLHLQIEHVKRPIIRQIRTQSPITRQSQTPAAVERDHVTPAIPAPAIRTFVFQRNEQGGIEETQLEALSPRMRAIGEELTRGLIEALTDVDVFDESPEAQALRRRMENVHDPQVIRTLKHQLDTAPVLNNDEAEVLDDMHAYLLKAGNEDALETFRQMTEYDVVLKHNDILTMYEDASESQVLARTWKKIQTYDDQSQDLLREILVLRMAETKGECATGRANQVLGVFGGIVEGHEVHTLETLRMELVYLASQVRKEIEERCRKGEIALEDCFVQAEERFMGAAHLSYVLPGVVSAQVLNDIYHESIKDGFEFDV